MSDSNENPKTAAVPATEAELDAIRYRGAPLPRPVPRPAEPPPETKTLSGAASDAVVAAGLACRQKES